MFRQNAGRGQIVRGVTSAAAIFATAAIGAAAGEGRLILAAVGTGLVLLCLEIPHIPGLRLLDANRWQHRFRPEQPAVPDNPPVPDELSSPTTRTGSRRLGNEITSTARTGRRHGTPIEAFAVTPAAPVSVSVSVAGPERSAQLSSAALGIRTTSWSCWRVV